MRLRKPGLTALVFGLLAHFPTAVFEERIDRTLRPPGSSISTQEETKKYRLTRVVARK